MEKFRKRITKCVKKIPIDCIVIGNAFGYLEATLEMFDTIFLFNFDGEQTKAKNLIYRKDLSTVYNMPNITAIFIDYKYIDTFEKLLPILTSAQPDLFIEGNEVVPKTETKSLYKHGYRAIAQLGFCHQWSKIA